MRALLLAAALLVGAQAHAEVLAHASNKSGGRINLTDQAGSCPDKQFFAFATSPEGEVHRGCWWAAYGHIWIQYTNGSLRAYDPTIFHVINKKGT
jgi:predicted dehydrogenase